ncbi:MAG TPA: glycosyltransferase family 2 protein [Chloroflexota bacterium]|nr:glycosyltransferase family 2 protein [Chloroflexota bacterium]
MEHDISLPLASRQGVVREVSQKAQGPEGQDIVISVVMPCLNEEETIGACVRKALEGIARTGLPGEVIVSDNGSTDRSVEIATELGARVIHQPQRGYGNAYKAGFDAARGKYIIMGDSDDTYDFSELGQLVDKLREGNEYVLGSRFAGTILPGAMPWANRYIGNPILTGMLNFMFGLKSSDAHSGFRAFTEEAYRRMRLQTTGMEFASELVINAARAKLKVAEVPITYYPRGGESKLHRVRDAWRHIRFMLLYSPDHLFVIPGVVLFLLGIAGMLFLLPGPQIINGHMFDYHFMFVASLLTIVGFQVLLTGFYAKAYAFTHRFAPDDRMIQAFYRYFNLEEWLLAGFLIFVAGLAIDVAIAVTWAQHHYRDLFEVRPALLALTLMVIGVQLMFSSFLLSILNINSRESGAPASQ